MITCMCLVLPQSLGLAHFIWITPLQCILCMGLIWELIEVNGFCALAALTLLGIIQAWLSQKMGPHRCVATCGSSLSQAGGLRLKMRLLSWPELIYIDKKPTDPRDTSCRTVLLRSNSWDCWHTGTWMHLEIGNIQTSLLVERARATEEGSRHSDVLDQPGYSWTRLDARQRGMFFHKMTTIASSC